MSFTPTLKDPAEFIRLRFAFGRPVVSIDSIVITPRGRVDEVAALSIEALVTADFEVEASVQGGTDGELYLVECRAVSAAGSIFEERQELLCIDLSWRVPGAAQPTYMDIAGFVARAGLDLTIQLTDEDGRGAIVAETLEAALLDAQAEADSYMAGRYQLPLALPAPAPLPTLIYDRALARLYKHGAPDQVLKRADEALRRLREIGDGKAQLAIAVPPAVTSPAPVLTLPGEQRLFTRDGLRGF